jgi:hypothetical protein
MPPLELFGFSKALLAPIQVREILGTYPNAAMARGKGPAKDVSRASAMLLLPKADPGCSKHWPDCRG